MLDLIILLITQLRSHDWRGALKTFVELIGRLVGGDEMPPMTISGPGEVHPDNTTDKHTVTIG